MNVASPFALLLLALVIILMGFNVLREDERAVIFRWGRLARGLQIPVVQINAERPVAAAQRVCGNDREETRLARRGRGDHRDLIVAGHAPRSTGHSLRQQWWNEQETKDGNQEPKSEEQVTPPNVAHMVRSAVYNASPAYKTCARAIDLVGLKRFNILSLP